MYLIALLLVGIVLVACSGGVVQSERNEGREQLKGCEGFAMSVRDVAELSRRETEQRLRQAGCTEQQIRSWMRTFEADQRRARERLGLSREAVEVTSVGETIRERVNSSPTPLPVTPTAVAASERVEGGTGCTYPRPSEAPGVVQPYIVSVACIQAGSRQGTGFVVRTGDDGEAYLLTNEHVTSGNPGSVRTWMFDGVYDGVVVVDSVERDLALVRICCGTFTALQRANRGAVFGEPGFAIGFPSGQFTVTEGMVRTVWDSFTTTIEHTADVQPGNSGGPLLVYSLLTVKRAEAGEGWLQRPEEKLSVLGITVAKSTEHEYTSYTIWAHDAVHLVEGTLGYQKSLTTRDHLALLEAGGDPYTVAW